MDETRVRREDLVEELQRLKARFGPRHLRVCAVEEALALHDLEGQDLDGQVLEGQDLEGARDRMDALVEVAVPLLGENHPYTLRYRLHALRARLAANEKIDTQLRTLGREMVTVLPPDHPDRDLLARTCERTGLAVPSPRRQFPMIALPFILLAIALLLLPILVGFGALTTTKEPASAGPGTGASAPASTGRASTERASTERASTERASAASAPPPSQPSRPSRRVVPGAVVPDAVVPDAVVPDDQPRLQLRTAGRGSADPRAAELRMHRMFDLVAAPGGAQILEPLLGGNRGSTFRATFLKMLESNPRRWAGKNVQLAATRLDRLCSACAPVLGGDPAALESLIAAYRGASTPEIQRDLIRFMDCVGGVRVGEFFTDLLVEESGHESRITDLIESLLVPGARPDFTSP